jgi:hypothetical protein
MSIESEFFDAKDIDSEEIEIEDNDSENNDSEDETYLFEPTLVPKFDAARDLDLGALGHEDETICKLMLWIYKTEREKQIADSATFHVDIPFTDSIVHETEYLLVSHADPGFRSTVAISGPDLTIWGIGDGRIAVGISQDGPFALLPNGMRVYRSPGFLGEMLYIFQW